MSGNIQEMKKTPISTVKRCYYPNCLKEIKGNMPITKFAWIFQIHRSTVNMYINWKKPVDNHHKDIIVKKIRENIDMIPDWLLKKWIFKEDTKITLEIGE